MEIRKINATDDPQAIGNIYARSWQAGYRGIVSQAYLDDLHGGLWLDFLTNEEIRSFVMLEGQHYIGTASVCPARDEQMPGWGELISIYLHPEYFGKGYGEGLLKHAMNALAEDGFQHIYAWVLAENRRAIRFYEKHGFQHQGDEMEVAVGGKALCGLRYSKRLP